MHLLRIATSGSVDDGKSTLIGRLLYETGQVPADRLAEIEERSRRHGLDYTDLSLLTDGLIAEREQGITIDVAHIYFSTDQRKYIIADTPGHEEYTRNMVTGASQSHAAIVLVDARNGVVRQTKRHLYISSMLDLPHLVVAVNKMDLVNYDPSVFQRLQEELRGLAQQFGYKGALHFVPISALKGDGVTQITEPLRWYEGAPLLDILESLELPSRDEGVARFQVQTVLRPHREGLEDYRGYAGVLSSGQLRKGQKLYVNGQGVPVTVEALEQWGNPLEETGPNRAVTLHLEEDVDLPRGAWLLGAPKPSIRDLQARVTWLDEAPLNPQVRYVLQHGTAEVACKVDAVDTVLDMDALQPKVSRQVAMNDVARIRLKTQRPIVAGDYRFGEAGGAFVLVDPQTRATVAAGLLGAGESGV